MPTGDQDYQTVSETQKAYQTWQQVKNSMGPDVPSKADINRMGYVGGAGIAGVITDGLGGQYPPAVPAVAPPACPNCGYCPHCGRSNRPLGPYEVPYNPHYAPQSIPWWQTQTITNQFNK